MFTLGQLLLYLLAMDVEFNPVFAEDIENSVSIEEDSYGKTPECYVEGANIKTEKG